MQKCFTGYGCQINADCMGGLCDPVTKTCSPTCTDTFQNGDETDVDCGGTCPLKCMLFQHCSGNGDCVNDNCQTGHCLP
jgi:hypothetical protein